MKKRAVIDRTYSLHPAFVYVIVLTPNKPNKRSENAMRIRIGSSVVILAALMQLPGQATQQNATATPPKATVIPSSALNTMFKTTVGDTRVDEPLRVVPAGGGRYGIYVLTEDVRPAATATGPIRGQFHNEVGEIYHVVAGAGTFLIGSEVDPATVTSRVSVLTGPGGNGVIKDPQFVKYQAGTILVIPPGVPHNATYEVTERTNFIIYRIDPKSSLPLK
jgi:mannose-6-phosphate isomerase-like protein (cupin superfamily)